MSLFRGQQSKMKSGARINTSACITQCEEWVEQVEWEVTGQQLLTITLIQCQGGIWRLHWRLVITVVTFPGGQTEFSLWCQSKTNEGVFSPEHLFNKVPREWVEVGVKTAEKIHHSPCTIPVNGTFETFQSSKGSSRELGIGTSPACVSGSQFVHYFSQKPFTNISPFQNPTLTTYSNFSCSFFHVAPLSWVNIWNPVKQDPIFML